MSGHEQDLKKHRLAVGGMTCAACSSRIERVLSNMEGIETAEVNLAAETLNVAFDPNATSLDAISERVDKLGFSLELPSPPPRQEHGRTRRYAISGMTCAACSSRVERVLSRLEGVESASVNLASEAALVRFVDGSDPAGMEDAVMAAVDKAGFGAAPEVADDPHSVWEQRQQALQENLGRMKSKLSLAFAFAAPLMLVSMGPMLGMPLPSGIDHSTAPLANGVLQLLLTLPVLWAGRDFYLKGFPNLFRGAPNMDSLIAVGTGAAIAYSVWTLVETALGVHMAEDGAMGHGYYFESAAMLVALVSLGKFFETRAKARTSEAIKGLMELAPETATLIRNGEQVRVDPREVVPGDAILIKPGERVVTDGVVEEGTSAVDESMLTGESIPVAKVVGDPVTGGTLNLQGAFTMRAEQVGADMALSRIIRMVQEAQGSKAPVANLADRVSLYFVPVVMALAVVAGGAWFLSGAGAAFSLRIFVAVLVIACPCAMGLATPTSIMAGTGRGAQLGVLIRSGAALEAAARISTLVMDKTGTLTLGTPALTGIHLVDGASFSEKQVLVLAASVESVSEHPLASAVVQAAKVRGVTLGEVQEFESVPGLGVKAVVLEAGQERKVTVGRVSFVEQELGGAGQSLAESAQSVADQGETPLAVAVDGRTEAVLAVADQVRPEAGEVVARLKAMGITPVMLTGDTQATARAVASALNISRVTAEVLPQDKADVVAALAKDSQGVGMVGDGVNDGPALARADVGLAMGGGAHVAVEAGDMTLMRSDLRGVLTALQLSRAVLRNIKQNLFWAFGYNVLGIPIAAGVLAVFGGPTLSPMIAGAAMALSSVSVVSNALRLKRFTPTWTRAKQEAQPEAVRSSS